MKTYWAQIDIATSHVILEWNPGYISPNKLEHYPDPGYGRMYDASGSEIKEPVIWANLSTGEIRIRTFDEDGSMADSNGNLLFITRQHKAPLRFIPFEC